ncbi:MAG: hypothetical protein IJ317_02100 [Clostridia bacterium]|nr:hypothetical protein [Clostridia bacterium]
MKTKVKRIVAVALLCVLGLLVGYSCYTGSRLTGYPKTLDGYKNTRFYGNDGTMVAFTDEYVWYERAEQGVFLLTLESYEQGVMLLKREGVEYRFTAIDGETLYDEQTKEFLIKGG